jgi:aconitate hydratase
MTDNRDQLKARKVLKTPSGNVVYFDLNTASDNLGVELDSLPYTIRVLLENVLRHCSNGTVTEDDVATVTHWTAKDSARGDIPFMPSRVLMQDFTGVPAVVDLTAMRAEVARRGGNPEKINPIVPVDLVIDHSVQVDFAGMSSALARNVDREYERNGERYGLLRWAQSAFDNLRVVPPGAGIVHQVNLEYLAKVVASRGANGGSVAFPDTLIGTDSHTTMINGLGVLGWGVGGIEAEAVLLGQPYYMLLPDVVGFRLTGSLPEGATATDLVLTAVQMLRERGVVGKFVEFCGPGLSGLPLPDRATIANMAPEYGATVGFFPIDEETLAYLSGTGRSGEQMRLVEEYARAQGLFRTDDSPEPQFSDLLELDLSNVEPSLAGPKRPQDKVRLSDMKDSFGSNLKEVYGKAGTATDGGASQDGLDHGSVVIAAITSCTNTSNPSVMVGAGLLAKKAVERGLETKPWVKTSMAPGSRVVEDYLSASGVLKYLEDLRFHIVGYGCTTCIGNSGPLDESISEDIAKGDLVAASVLSGNRNFEGRVHPVVKANYLASPMLVVAFALAGRVDIDLTTEPLGTDTNGQPVFLKELWPSQQEVRDTLAAALQPGVFQERYGKVFQGDDRWQELEVPQGSIYQWDRDSTYVKELPIFRNLPDAPSEVQDIRKARVLVKVGDSITTDHISPAGRIQAKSPAGYYLTDKNVSVSQFNAYGARRGNHEVMMRGTFANVRLRNQLAPGTEGGWTRHLPDGMDMNIFEASEEYKREGVPTLVLAGKEYGSGSSRDWAAKGPYLLGIKATLAESYERIHRSNLVGMGVLPLQYKPGENAESLGLSGEEAYDVEGIADGLTVGKELRVTATLDSGTEKSFSVIARIDVPIELEYYRHGGVLQYVLRQLMKT